MKILNCFDDASGVIGKTPTVVTIGKFNAMHLAHKKIVSDTVSYAKKNGCLSVVFTYNLNDEHKNTESMRSAVKVLCPTRKRFEMFDELGVDILINFDANEDFYKTTSADFVRNILVEKLNCKVLVTGFNSKMGSDFATAETIADEFGDIDVITVSPIECDGEVISSSEILNLLTAGNISSVNKMLGRNYTVYGVVYKGIQLGAKIGFPTANFGDTENLLPKTGVYAGYLNCEGERYKAMCSVSNNPTVSHRDNVLLEANCFTDKNLDLYWKHANFEFVEYLRGTHAFESVDALKAQLKKDKEKALRVLR